MKLLLFGKDGQVGWQLQRALLPLGTVTALGRAQVDVRDLESVANVIRAVEPDVIINAAAYTAVDKAEVESSEAMLVNGQAVGAIADAAARVGAWFIHYSTDYVFDGSKAGKYSESDLPVPANAYGRSKRLGEELIESSGCRHIILRAQWIYSSGHNNFPLAILRRAARQSTIDVVADSIGAPTSSELVADATAGILYRLLAMDPAKASALSGIYHLAADGETSWYEYAVFLLEIARQRGMKLMAEPSSVRPIPSSSFPTLALRPLNCRLSTQKLRQEFGLTLPDWKVHLIRFTDELTRVSPLGST